MKTIVEGPMERPIVYIRAVEPDELPDHLRSSDNPVYAVHDEDGNRLALAADRGIAFALAKQNELEPLSVH